MTLPAEITADVFRGKHPFAPAVLAGKKRSMAASTSAADQIVKKIKTEDEVAVKEEPVETVNKQVKSEPMERVVKKEEDEDESSPPCKPKEIQKDVTYVESPRNITLQSSDLHRLTDTDICFEVWHGTARVSWSRAELRSKASVIAGVVAKNGSELSHCFHLGEIAATAFGRWLLHGARALFDDPSSYYRSPRLPHIFFRLLELAKKHDIIRLLNDLVDELLRHSLFKHSDNVWPLGDNIGEGQNRARLLQDNANGMLRALKYYDVNLFVRQICIQHIVGLLQRNTPAAQALRESAEWQQLCNANHELLTTIAKKWMNGEAGGCKPLAWDDRCKLHDHKSDSRYEISIGPVVVSAAALEVIREALGPVSAAKAQTTHIIENASCSMGDTTPPV